MLATTVFYWILVILIELRAFDYIRQKFVNLLKKGFALLGITGAGKSSCFKCLTGEMYPDSGSLSINGHDLTKQTGFEKARSLIGYCP